MGSPPNNPTGPNHEPPPSNGPPIPPKQNPTPADLPATRQASEPRHKKLSRLFHEIGEAIGEAEFGGQR